MIMAVSRRGLEALAGAAEAAYHRCRAPHGGLKANDAKRFEDWRPRTTRPRQPSRAPTRTILGIREITGERLRL
jgi:hypothetical protein